MRDCRVQIIRIWGEIFLVAAIGVSSVVRSVCHGYISKTSKIEKNNNNNSKTMFMVLVMHAVLVLGRGRGGLGPLTFFV